MKIRQGFVSNSSSSSFIVAYKIDKCVHCGRIDFDVETLINLAEKDDYGNDETKLRAVGKSDILSATDWFSEENRDEMLTKLDEIDETQYKIIYFSIDNSSRSTIRSILNEMEARGSLIRIYEEN